MADPPILNYTTTVYEAIRDHGLPALEPARAGGDQ